MNPFVVKPGESVVGVGLDFASRLSAGELIQSATITPPEGVTVATSDFIGTVAVTKLVIADDQEAADLDVLFTVTGTAGSIRKGYRTLLIRRKSN